MLGGKGQLKHRAVRLEHLGQHARGQLAGQLPLGFGAQIHGRVGFLHQGFAVVQRHGSARLPQQQAVFGQKAGKQHAVPMLVGYFPDQLLHGLGVVIGFGIAQRAAMGAQAAAQGFVFFRQVVGRPTLGHGQLGQRGAGAFLGDLAGSFDGGFKLGALGFGQGLVQYRTHWWLRALWVRLGALRSSCPRYELPGHGRGGRTHRHRSRAPGGCPACARPSRRQA